jgi:hypothetical protein
VWDEIRKYLPQFSSAVLNGVDAEGYPYSVRCHPYPEPSAGLLRMGIPADIAIRPGRERLLRHSHDDLLWNQRMFLVRGRLERGEDGCSFAPEHLVPGMGLESTFGTARTVIGIHRSSTTYLTKCDLARPRVLWNEIDAVKEQTYRS